MIKMEDGDTVLSDVHVGASHDETTAPIVYSSSSRSHEVKVGLSRFQFKWPPSPINKDAASSGQQFPAGDEVAMETQVRDCLKYDEDGDIEVQRNHENLEVITLEHGLATPLTLVGLQVWSGALILSDYLLHISHQLCDKIVLELGAGSGLTSIVASKFARLIICTDTKEEVLQLCQSNVLRNTKLDNVTVKELDWCRSDPFSLNSDKWSWSQQDLETLNKTDFIIAADVIYSNALTDSFFTVLKPLLKMNRPVIVLISLEKRLNFTLEDLEICCPAYDHFLVWTQKLKQEQPPLLITQISTDFPKYFSYERTKYLEIWKITNEATRH